MQFAKRLFLQSMKALLYSKREDPCNSLYFTLIASLLSSAASYCLQQQLSVTHPVLSAAARRPAHHWLRCDAGLQLLQLLGTAAACWLLLVVVFLFAGAAAATTVATDV